MPTTSIHPSAEPLQALFIVLLLALAIVAYAGAWLVVAALYGGHAGWMALLAAPVVLALLQIARIPAGAWRAILAVSATAAAIGLGNWLVLALPIAQAMNLTPLAAARRIGPDFFWMLVALGTTPLDWLCIALALALAAWLGR
jgi:hypothetical protein